MQRILNGTNADMSKTIENVLVGEDPIGVHELLFANVVTLCKGFHAVLRHLRVDSPYLSLAVPPRSPERLGLPKRQIELTDLVKPTLGADARRRRQPAHWKLAVGIAQGLRRSVTGDPSARAGAAPGVERASRRAGIQQRRCRLACGRATMR